MIGILTDFYKSIRKEKKVMSNGCNQNPMGACSEAEGINTTANGTGSHAEGINTIANGAASHAEGSTTTAVGAASHTEGYETDTTADAAHAEGSFTTASGVASHAEGYQTNATADTAHAEGSSTTASGNASHAEGIGNTASGRAAHVEGGGSVLIGDLPNIASGDSSHAEGLLTTASGEASHAEGFFTTASNFSSHTEGYGTTSDGIGSHSEGQFTTASGPAAHAEGSTTQAQGVASHAEGTGTQALADNSHAEGFFTTVEAAHTGSHIMGRFGTTEEEFSWFIGNGTSLVTPGLGAKWLASDGSMYVDGIFVPGGADYAEMFETTDGNPIDVGYFVTFDGASDKIRKATSQDSYILGISSATPSVIGNSGEMRWKDKFVTDEWGRIQHHKVTISAQKDEEGRVITPAREEIQWMINPEWDPTRGYVSRLKRPEWVAIGLLGQILVRDDGTCIAGSYCMPNMEGIATATDKGYRVMKRTGPNQVLVLLK